MGDGRFSRAGRVIVAASLAVSLCPVAQVSAFAEGQEPGQAGGADLELYANPDAPLGVWYKFGTCEWSVDENYCLVVRPSNGAQTGTLAAWGSDCDAKVAPWYRYMKVMKSVRFEGTVKATVANGMFSYSAALETVDLNGLDTSEVKDFSGFLADCPSLTSVDLSMLDFSSAEKITTMFSGNASLKSINMSGIFAPKVTSMFSMFAILDSLESVDLSGFKAPQLTNLTGMFSRCGQLKQVDLSGFETSKVTSLEQMFNMCSSIETIDLSGFDTSNVTNMLMMFARCESLKNVNLTSFNTSKVQTFERMFQLCTSLESVDVSNFDTSGAEDLDCMFQACDALKSVDVSGFDTSNVRYFNGMFHRCGSLTSLDVSHFDTSKGVSFTGMFNACAGLRALDVTNFDTSSAKELASVFKNCASLEALDLSSFDTSVAEDTEFFLLGCDSLRAITVGPKFAIAEFPNPAGDPDGKWIDAKTGAEYSTNEIPANKAATYNAKANINANMFQLEAGEFTYTGSAIKPKVSSSLPEGSYSVAYDNNVDAGAAVVRITGTGAYPGTCEIPFTISPADIAATDVEVSQLLTDESSSPATKLTFNGKTLQEGVDYRVSYAGGDVPGPAVATIEGLGNFSGTIAKSFTVEKDIVYRLAGEEAADTAALIARAAVQGGSSEYVVVARDDDFADAMSATGLAGQLNAPIVLTNRYSLSSVAADAIQQIGAKKAYVIGGTGAIPADLESQLKEIGCTVEERVFGEEACDTSVACAQKIKALGGSCDFAVIAYGQNFQDALSMSSFAYAHKAPIFLQTDGDTSKDRHLTTEALSLLTGSGAYAAASVFVAGGHGAVSEESAEGAIGGLRGGARLAGETGYDTSNQIAHYMIEKGLLSAANPCVANGAPDPKGLDALAGAALAGKAGSVMLLTNPRADLGDSRNSCTIKGTDSNGDVAFLAKYAGAVQDVAILGGTYVMPSSVSNEIKDVLR